ncbi:MAG: peptidylprolyl isomerase [Haloechinothrix sp.]
MATNQQRREAAKRKLDHQLEHRAQRAKRNRIVGVAAVIGAVVLIAGLIVFLATRESPQSEPAAAEDEQAGQEQPRIQIPTERAAVPERSTPLPDPQSCQYPAGQEEPAKQVSPPKDGKVPSTGTVEVTFASSAGDIPMTLDRALAPCTVNSTLHLIEQGFYDNTECHRLGTQGLQMLQCGDPSGTGSGGPGYTVPDEFFPELSYGRGILAMANTGQPNSGGSQFFMVFGQAELPPNYTVFGTISDAGLNVLDKIAHAGDDGSYEPSPGGGKPNTPVKISEVIVQ